MKSSIERILHSTISPTSSFFDNLSFFSQLYFGIQAGTESENTTLLSEALINVVQLKAGSDNTKSPDECPGTTLVVMDGPKDEFTVDEPTDSCC